MKEQNDNNTRWDERLFNAVNHNVYIPEVFKTLRFRILYPGNNRSVPRTVMITSVLPGEGKSFVAANLGISLALGMDQYSLLVDCDLRRPSLATLFGLGSPSGLSDFLAGKSELQHLIIKDVVNKLSLLSSGTPPVNPAELLSSERMKSLVDELAGRYSDRIIIFDTPPALVASESVVLAQQVDAVIVVVREGGAARQDLSKMVNLIGPERVLGVVYNAQATGFMEKTILQHGSGYYSEPSKE